MQPRLHLQTLISALDFTGIAIASIGGALHARRHREYDYDVIGAFGLALISALGGGVARDVLLQHGPPLALVDVRYLYTALGAAAVTLLLGSKFIGFHIGERMQRAMTVVDSAALALFAVAGTTRAQSFGLTWLPAVMLGITTAVGGGSLRDIVSGSTPTVFQRGNFYAIAALAAALTYLLLDKFNIPDLWCVAAAVLVGFTLRMLSLRFNWKTDPLRTSSP
jgi:uncharacterized membrane protein YeiH